MTRDLRSIHTIAPARRIRKSGTVFNRAFEVSQALDLDPFLLMDETHFTAEAEGDAQHMLPHSNHGIDTVTYVLFGSMQYKSSIEHEGIIQEGGCRWVQSAGGIIHSEVPVITPGEFWAIRLWINSPSEEKHGAPWSKSIDPQDVPVHRGEEGIITRIIAGEYEEILGPGGRSPDECLFLDVSIPPLTPFQISIPHDYQVLLYCLEGTGLYDFSEGHLIREHDLVQYGPGDRIAVTTENDEVRLLLMAARPIGEITAKYGPFFAHDQISLDRAIDGRK